LITPVSVTTFAWSYIANEWWVEAGVSNITATTAMAAAVVKVLSVRVVIAAPMS
jgi:hypothetical protein